MARSARISRACADSPSEAGARAQVELMDVWRCASNNYTSEPYSTLATLSCAECAYEGWCNPTGGLLPSDEEKPYWAKYSCTGIQGGASRNPNPGQPCQPNPLIVESKSNTPHYAVDNAYTEWRDKHNQICRDINCTLLGPAYAACATYTCSGIDAPVHRQDYVYVLHSCIRWTLCAANSARTGVRMKLEELRRRVLDGEVCGGAYVEPGIPLWFGLDHGTSASSSVAMVLVDPSTGVRWVVDTKSFPTLEAFRRGVAAFVDAVSAACRPIVEATRKVIESITAALAEVLVPAPALRAVPSWPPPFQTSDPTPGTRSDRPRRPPGRREPRRHRKGTDPLLHGEHNGHRTHAE